MLYSVSVFYNAFASNCCTSFSIDSSVTWTHRFICILRFRNRRKIFFKPPFLWEIHFSLSLPLRFLSISIHYWEKNADITYLLYHIYSKLSTPEVIFFIFSNIFLILADFLWLYRWCARNKFFSFINFLFPP